MGVALKKGDFDMGNRRYSEMGFFEIYFTVCGKTEHEFEFGSKYLSGSARRGGAQKTIAPFPHINIRLLLFLWVLIVFRSTCLTRIPHFLPI